MYEFQKITDSLSNAMRKKLGTEIEIISNRLKTVPGTFWKDPIKKREARAKMREAWAKRDRTKLQVTYRSTGEMEVWDTYEEVAGLVRQSPHTVRCMVSRGKGTADFRLKDLSDVIEVARV